MNDIPSSPEHHRVVPPEAAGTRLDVFLARQPEVDSRTLAKSLVQEGKALVDGLRAKPGQSLAPGQIVTFDATGSAPPNVEPAAPQPPLRILYEDAWLLVIDKPAGLAAHPPEGVRGRHEPSVAKLALAHCGTLPLVGGEDRPGIVHRLDRDTSGVMVLPKNDEAFHFVQSQFKARSVAKEYRAIAFGEARFDSDHIVRNIAVHPTTPGVMTVVAEGGKEADTYYEVVERFTGFTHFRCLPKSGRTHQIRVHLMSIGHSLVGDRVYRSRIVQHAKLPEGAPEPARHCLHALRIGLLHPRTHEHLTFDAPLPDDMRLLLEWLREHRPSRDR